MSKRFRMVGFKGSTQEKSIFEIFRFRLKKSPHDKKVPDRVGSGLMFGGGDAVFDELFEIAKVTPPDEQTEIDDEIIDQLKEDAGSRHDVAIMPQIPSGFGQNRGILFFAEDKVDAYEIYASNPTFEYHA